MGDPPQENNTLYVSVSPVTTNSKSQDRILSDCKENARGVQMTPLRYL